MDTIQQQIIDLQTAIDKCKQSHKNSTSASFKRSVTALIKRYNKMLTMLTNKI
jgi:hypothetical protein